MKNLKFINVIFPLLCLIFISCDNKKVETKAFSEIDDSLKVESTCCKNNRNSFLLLENDSVEISSPLVDISDDNLKMVEEMILIQGGEYMMGSSSKELALRREFPRHKVKVKSFLMDVHEVTNKQFAKFVEETGYITVAEKYIDWNELKNQLPPKTPKPDEEFLMPGSLVFLAPKSVKNLIDYSQWWSWIKGANWMHPTGPNSNLDGKDDFPVVHIAYDDAVAFAKWCGKRLPTEAEWEWAARGGLEDKLYPWGDESVDVGKPKCNYWSGTFPTYNDTRDGFASIAPVMQYPANGYGLFDMAGNVWEICADWFDDRYYESFDSFTTADNPTGPKTWYFPPEPYDPKRVVRGGSFLCNDSYCSSYRVSARMPHSKDTGMNHTGFRCVRDI